MSKSPTSNQNVDYGVNFSKKEKKNGFCIGEMFYMRNRWEKRSKIGQFIVLKGK